MVLIAVFDMGYYFTPTIKKITALMVNTFQGGSIMMFSYALTAVSVLNNKKYWDIIS